MKHIKEDTTGLTQEITLWIMHYAQSETQSLTTPWGWIGKTSTKSSNTTLLNCLRSLPTSWSRTST